MQIGADLTGRENAADQTYSWIAVGSRRLQAADEKLGQVIAHVLHSLIPSPVRNITGQNGARGRARGLAFSPGIRRLSPQERRQWTHPPGGRIVARWLPAPAGGRGDAGRRLTEQPPMEGGDADTPQAVAWPMVAT